jgi:hypothetical protein
MTIRGLTQTSNLLVYADMAQSPIFNIHYNGVVVPAAPTRIASCLIRPNDPTVLHALSINDHGCVGIGTSLPSSILELRRDAAVQLQNNYNFVRAGNVFTVNGNGCLGIGTTIVPNNITVSVANTSTLPSTIGLNHLNTTQPFFIASSNSQEVIKMTYDGKLIMGNALATNTAINIADNLTSKIPQLQVNRLYALSPSTNINVSSSSLSNVNFIYASDVQTTRLNADSIETDYFNANTFDVAGMNITPSLARITSTTSVFSTNPSFSIEDLNRSRVIVESPPSVTSGDINPGLTVIGQNNTSLVVKSTINAPFIELATNAHKSLIYMDNEGNLKLGANAPGNEMLSLQKNINTLQSLTTNTEMTCEQTFRLSTETTTIRSKYLNLVNRNELKYLYATTISKTDGDSVVVGIGEISGNPLHELDVAGSIGARSNLHVTNGIYVGQYAPTNDNSALLIDSTSVGSGILLKNYGSGSPFVVDSSTCKFTINASGDAGIGTTMPEYGLHVADNKLGYFGSNVLVNGQVLNVSDRTVKRDFSIISDALEKIEQINGYTYTRIGNGAKETGLIAQEVQQVLPEVVSQVAPDSLLHISYGNMAGLFVQAIKEMNEKVSGLERVIADLSSRIPGNTTIASP